MAVFLILLFLMLLSNPEITVLGAKTGLNLWLNSVVPSLLPFLIFSNLLFEADAVSYLTALLSPLCRLLFGTSKDGSFAVISGFLCGFPMGSKSCLELVKRQKIKKEEAAYLVSFCNNASPAFVVSFICQGIFYGEKEILLPVLFSFYAAPLITGILFGFFFRKRQNFYLTVPSDPALHKKSSVFQFQYLDHAIMNSFQTIVRLGGYITFFAVLSTFLQSAQWLPIPLRIFLTAVIELTTGASLLGKLNLSLKLRVIAVCACVSFGSLSGFAQSYTLLKEGEISAVYYLIGKLMACILCTIFLNILL
ncbi:MAG: hypothetical protein OSJ62_05065 [Lachnospiraceae bacterium]|nr:hypothetical protein [Lachnospiraceae bacterium]